MHTCLPWCAQCCGGLAHSWVLERYPECADANLQHGVNIGHIICWWRCCCSGDGYAAAMEDLEGRSKGLTTLHAGPDKTLELGVGPTEAEDTIHSVKSRQRFPRRRKGWNSFGNQRPATRSPTQLNGGSRV